MLDGYKTYICMILGLIMCMLFGAGVIDEPTFLLCLGFLGFGSAGALRSAIKKMILEFGK